MFSDSMILAVLVPLLLVACVAVGLLARLTVWDKDRKQRHALERAGEADAERAVNWDAQRAAELEGWLRSGALPTPISRLYPAYQEFTWEWGRLQACGYQLDHDPIPLDDGQLMVTYSLTGVVAAESEAAEPDDQTPVRPYVVADRQLPSPPG